MYDNLLPMLASFDVLSIEQAVDLGETLGYWEQYKDKNVTDRGMHIWHLQMNHDVWNSLYNLRLRNKRKSISFPGPGRAHVWGRHHDGGLVSEFKSIKITKTQLKKLILKEFLETKNT